LLDWQAERAATNRLLQRAVPLAARGRCATRWLDGAPRFGAAGLQPGDLVAIMAGNCLETLDAILGASWAGLVSRHDQYLRAGHQLTHVLSDSGARLAVADAERAPILLEQPPRLEFD